MTLALDPHLFKDLRAEANRYMWSAWHQQFGSAQHVGEVPCIKNLVEKALPQVERSWRVKFPVDISLNLKAVLCHGKPWVTYAGAGKSCELGDVLLVHEHLIKGQIHSRRAALVQAKIFGPGGVPTYSRNTTQLALYQSWPEFTYTNWPGGPKQLQQVQARFAAVSSTPLARNFAHGLLASKVDTVTIDHGARYGMIDLGRAPWRSYNCPNPWRLCSANVQNLYNHTHGQSLAGYLLRLMIGMVGRNVPTLDYPIDLHASCHWSLVVKELLSLLPAASQIITGHSGSKVSLLIQPPIDLPGSDGRGSEDGSFAVILATTTGRPDRDRD